MFPVRHSVVVVVDVRYNVRVDLVQFETFVNNLSIRYIHNDDEYDFDVIQDVVEMQLEPKKSFDFLYLGSLSAFSILINTPSLAEELTNDAVFLANLKLKQIFSFSFFLCVCAQVNLKNKIK